eukprot:scaffold22413_cov19-Tisochrysis_lutea.AAC.2
MQLLLFKWSKPALATAGGATAPRLTQRPRQSLSYCRELHMHLQCSEPVQRARPVGRRQR